MSFTVPPLPGERLLTPKEVARRTDCHITAIYKFINDGKLATVMVAESFSSVPVAMKMCSVRSPAGGA